MDAGTMKDYIEDLIQQVNLLEEQFRKLNAVIVQLQEQRDQYRRMYEATL
jgi:prefoldin subunit 5